MFLAQDGFVFRKPVTLPLTASDDDPYPYKGHDDRFDGIAGVVNKGIAIR